MRETMKPSEFLSLILTAVLLLLAVSSSGCGQAESAGSQTEPEGSLTLTETQPDEQIQTAELQTSEDTEKVSSVIPGPTAKVLGLLRPESNQFTIVYDFNGGELGLLWSMSGTGKSIRDKATGKIRVTRYESCIVQVVTGSEYICPHSLGDEGYLAREGYVLYGYNTEPDGSGEYFGCGWNVPSELGGKSVLYAMWAKSADSSELTAVQNVSLKKYTGSGSVVAIPEGIKTVFSYAFSGCPVETVILPKTVTKLEARAFYNCPNLKNVYMYDLITDMSAESFEGCNNFRQLYINNANKIKYLGGMKQGSYMRKFQRLKVMENKKKIVLIGGSNLCYGLDSALLKDLLNDEYEIINWGTMYYLSSVFFIDVTSHFLNEGDIVVTCPEEEPAQWGQIWSNSKFYYASYLFYSCEGCMEVFSYIDMVKYRRLLPSIAAANADRMSGTYSYESFYSAHSVNEYGDFDDARSQTKRKSYDSYGKLSGWSNTGYLSWAGSARCAEYFTAENVANLNGAFEACVARGAKAFISFSVSDIYYFSDTSEATLKAYEDAIVKNYVTGHEGVSLISSVRTYLFDDSKFYNSMHHLLWEPARERTRLLYKDIARELGKNP